MAKSAAKTHNLCNMNEQLPHAIDYFPHTSESQSAVMPNVIEPDAEAEHSNSVAAVSAPKISRRRWIFAPRGGLPLLLGALTFLLYAFNVSPTVTYGSDCGEFAAVAYRLGIGHPTGFVVYSLIGRTFISLLPVGEVAWRLNILSALCGAATVGLVAAILGRVLLPPRTSPRISLRSDAAKNSTERVLDSCDENAIAENAATWAMCGAAFLLAGFYSFIGQALIMDVHIMIAALTSLILYFAVRWHESVRCGDADWRWIFSMALLAGIMLNTHMSWIFTFPGLFALSVWSKRAVFGTRREFWRRFGALLAFCAASYLLTLYLPLRATLFPTPPDGQWWPLDWSHIVDFSAWSNHVRAKQYEFLFLQPTRFEFGGHVFVMKWLAAPLSTIPGKLLTLFELMAAQLLGATLLLPLGAFVACKRDRAIGIALLLIALVNLGFEINYDVPIGELANFLFPMYIVMALWIGYALQEILLWAARFGTISDAVSKAQSSVQSGENAPPEPINNGRVRWYLRTVLKLMIPAMIAVQWLFSVPATSRRGDTSARDAALERADALENLQRKFPGKPVVALATSSDDTLWSLWYAQFVLGRARGVATPWGVPWRRQLKEKGWPAIVADWQRRGPVAVTYFHPEIDAKFPYVPLSKNGLLWLASRRALPLPATPLTQIEYSKYAKNAKSKSESAISAQILGVSFPAVRMRTGAAHLKRENLTNFTLDFRVPFSSAISTQNSSKNRANAAQKNDAQQIGFVQILTAPIEKFANAPSPSQGFVGVKSEGRKNPLATEAREPTAKVSLQTLRLVVPPNSAVGTEMRTILPLQIEVDGLGKYVLWLRFVRRSDDKKTSWQRTATIVVTAS